jgi:hypothetical protein
MHHGLLANMSMVLCYGPGGSIRLCCSALTSVHVDAVRSSGTSACWTYCWASSRSMTCATTACSNRPRHQHGSQHAINAAADTSVWFMHVCMCANRIADSLSLQPLNPLHTRPHFHSPRAAAVIAISTHPLPAGLVVNSHKGHPHPCRRGYFVTALIPKEVQGGGTHAMPQCRWRMRRRVTPLAAHLCSAPELGVPGLACQQHEPRKTACCGHPVAVSVVSSYQELQAHARVCQQLLSLWGQHQLAAFLAGLALLACKQHAQQQYGHSTSTHEWREM